MSTAKYKHPVTGQWTTVPGMTITDADQMPHREIPDYVKREAMEVAQKVRAVQTPNTITFLAMSDFHHCAEQSDTNWQDNTNAGNLHACMGAKILSYCLDLDFVCHLGDLSFGHSTTTTQLLRSQISQLNGWFRESWKGLPQFRTVGNHDTGQYGGELVGTDYLYDAIGSHCAGAVCGSTEHGYCYRDFPEKKLRVICLNTSEGESLYGEDAPYICSPAQLSWFAQALQEAGGKEGWGILVLSHYPLDYLGTHPASGVVKAYLEGASVVLDGSTVSFSGFNKAKFIAQFHGHTHCLKYDRLHSIDETAQSATAMDAWRVAVPNASFYRNNHHSGPDKYGITFGEEITYDKAAETGADTAFTVNVVDPEKELIYSFCYGAGYDRVISYAQQQYWQVSQNLTHVYSSGQDFAVTHGQSYETQLTPEQGYQLQYVRVTMDGQDITESACTDGRIYVEEVTGNLVITAAAAAVSNYVNQIPISTDENGNIYNGCGYKAEYRLESSGGEDRLTGHFVTGFIPCSYGDSIYLRNVTYQHSIGSSSNQRLSFYDAQKNHLGQLNANTARNILLDGQAGSAWDDSGIYTRLDVGDSPVDCANAAYFRINAIYIGEDSVITVNQPLD